MQFICAFMCIQQLMALLTDKTAKEKDEEIISAKADLKNMNLCEEYTGTYVVSTAIVSHENCGLDYSPMNQMGNSHVKKLANDIDVSDQSKEGLGLNQRKGNTKNRFSKYDEWG